MRNPGGNIQMFGDLGLPQPQVPDLGNRSLLTQGEVDSFTCFHCQHVVMVPVKANPEDIGGFCKICTKLICKYCLRKGCTPWEKKMEKMEARYDALRSYGL